MPDRMIRDELLRSDRFLELPDNTARMCYVAVLLVADDFGNAEATPGALVRLWRDFGVDSREKAASVLSQLCDADLARRYEAEGKPYLHIPRFRQRVRHTKRAHPRSPFEESELNQRPPSENASRPPGARQSPDRHASAEEKRREEKRSTPSSSSYEDSEGESALIADLTNPPAKTLDRLRCPVEAIVAAYNEVCTLLPQAEQITDQRRSFIQARWRDRASAMDWSTTDQGLAYFRAFFARVQRSRFLTGQVPAGPNRERPFRADLEWLMRPSNFAKIAEGKYD